MRSSSINACQATVSTLSGLPPFLGPSPRLLILGSFPSVESLRIGEYYGFPRNHFWFLVAAAFDEAIPRSWPEKSALLSRCGIALWDAAASCSRNGSLDQAIRAVAPNPIIDLLRDHPTIGKVVCNGTKASELFARTFLGEVSGFPRSSPIPLAPASLSWGIPDPLRRTVALTRVPSSSPVPSREYRCAEDKQEAWKAALA